MVAVEKSLPTRLTAVITDAVAVERIRAALDDDRLVLYAQLIVEVTSRATVQHELLVSMIGPEGEVAQRERAEPD